MSHPAIKVMMIFLIGLGFSACADATIPTSPTTWKSQHFDISATLTEGWSKTHVQTPGDTFDLPDKMIAAFVNKSGPYGYIIRVEKDPTTDQITNDDYLAAVRQQFEAVPEYTLVDEADVDFHDREFHRKRYQVDGEKGLAAMCFYIHRKGGILITLQMTFPLDENGVMDIPPTLAEFDSGVKINL